MNTLRTGILGSNFSVSYKKECTSTFPWMVSSLSNNAQFIFGDIEKHKVFTNR